LKKQYFACDGVDTQVGIAAPEVVLHHRCLARKDVFKEGLDRRELCNQSIA
jgi:hypothetical protein